MLIKQFCEATELPRDTVRFYIKRGLLKPEVGCGAGNRYQVFDNAQVERAKLIKLAQRLGFTLKQIADLGQRYDAKDIGPEAKMAILREQIDGIAEQERQLKKMRKYLTAKFRWIEDGETGSPPTFFWDRTDPAVSNDTPPVSSRGKLLNSQADQKDRQIQRKPTYAENQSVKRSVGGLSGI